MDLDPGVEPKETLLSLSSCIAYGVVLTGAYDDNSLIICHCTNDAVQHLRNVYISHIILELGFNSVQTAEWSK